jgi:hypothetical protein
MYRKSKRCGSTSCIEILEVGVSPFDEAPEHAAEDVLQIRSADSVANVLPNLQVTREEFTVFVRGCKDGDFDDMLLS